MNNDFIKKLLKEKEVFESKGVYGDYTKPVMPEVYEYQKQYRIEKNRPQGTIYNSELENYIIEKENIPENLRDYIKTEVYLSQKTEQKQNRENYKNKMLSEG
jgi:hypothetical protein